MTQDDVNAGPVHRGLLGIDIEGFNRPTWTDPVRRRLRGRLYRLADQALAHARVTLAQAVRSDVGDGLWLLVVPQVSTARLLHPLATSLASGLAVDNRQAPADERMRLRVVAHAGELLADPHGYAGASWNLAARLLDAEATRAVLVACPAADLVLVVSEPVYDGIVRHGYEGIDPAGWQPIRIHTKETRTRAWVHLPGQAVQPRLPQVLLAPRAGPASLPIPRELPRPPADFTGRTEELSELRDLLAGSAGRASRGWPVVISAIDGMGGVGKSALAIQAATQLALASDFPDGQLYVNLQGATPGLAPLEPLDALSRLLRSLGLDPAAIPTTVEEAAARFRSLAADRRLLLVLDNAHDAEQVRPLLPASATCAVLVTSRQVLATLDGARAVHLDVLPERQALELLGRIAGEQRTAAEPHAAIAVVGSCGRLPLAIRIAGSRLAARPTWPVQALADCLADATARLEELQTGMLAVRASFDVSLHALQESSDLVDRTAAAAFGLLSLPDGPDLGMAAAARLLDQPQRATHRLLERLVDAQLLEAPRPGRYQFHDLVRVYARAHAVNRYGEAERLAGLTRLTAFYTATARHVWTLVDPGNSRAVAAGPQWTRGGLRFADDLAAALSWLEAERPNLLAAIAQAAQAAPAVPAELPSQLTRALAILFEMHGYWHDGVQANQTVLALARRTGDRAAQAHALNDLGRVYAWPGRYAEVITYLQASLTLYRELGDRGGQVNTLTRLGRIHGRVGRHAEAIAYLQEGLTISREVGNRHDQAHSLTRLGGVLGQVGRYDEAIVSLQESLALSREIHNSWHQANNLHDLGCVYGQMGRFEEASSSLQQSLTLYQELGNRSGQADSLHDLGSVYGQMGRFEEASSSLQQSLTLRRELDDRHGQAETLRDLGDALHAVAQHQHARAAWREALTICESLQLPEVEGLRVRLAATSTETPSRRPAG